MDRFEKRWRITVEEYSHARVAMRSDPERNRRGEVCMSAETAFSIHTLDFACIEYFPEFLKLAGHLPERDREVWLCYYILAKPQTTIARCLGVTQTFVATSLKRSLRLLRKESFAYDKWEPEARIIYKTDPACLGHFRVDVADVKDVFPARAEIRENTNDAYFEEY